MEIILSILFLLMRFFDFLTTPIFKYRSKGARKFLPPLKSDLLRISATELAKKIRNKEISSEEICQVYIDRIKEVNPILNAVVEERFRYAMREAKNVDGYLKTTSLSIRELEKIKPLLGVPITVKECCSVKDLSLCVGLQSRKGFKAETDGEAVAKIRSSGGIVLLVSAAPEMAMAWECYNHVNGYTNNPYDTTCTSGGSSGGEGALLGACASLIGIGSDIAGSVRLPAAFNGVFGHKPTPRTVPLKGHFPIGHDEKYYDFLVIGPLVRYACDFKLIMNAMCGSRIGSELNLYEHVDLSKLNVFYLESLNFNVTLPRVSKEIQAAVRDSVSHLKSHCGAKVHDYKFDEFKNVSVVCGSSIFSLKDIPNVLKGENSLFIVELTKSLFGRSKFTHNLMVFYFFELLFKYVVGDYSQDNAKLKTFIVEKLKDNGVIILPTFHEPAHKHNQAILKNGYAYMIIANALGLPATSIPCGFDKDGMPIGVQVIAAPYQDRLCIAVAEELERHFGGWIPPPEND
ncbi:fatty-acid amide hydrolase 2-like [Sitophilus oryzae]|uniref:Fatty-acid amide hydrolase 2-like n=1 Tax=Sitophilus oryzae TaxID=7048 RepID=A0A6J2XQE8_SITOR|nr:fatty-acid amide hydrolase 2-like [Sitophilus oryzae]